MGALGEKGRYTSKEFCDETAGENNERQMHFKRKRKLLENHF